LDDGFVLSDIEKISSIPGLWWKFDQKSFKSQLRKIGCCSCEQPNTAVPIDVQLTKLCKEIGTNPSIPLLVGSILCEKSSSGVEGLALDVKWGKRLVHKRCWTSEATWGHDNAGDPCPEHEMHCPLWPMPPGGMRLTADVNGNIQNYSPQHPDQFLALGIEL
jgi:hypothetical protein